MDQCQSNSFEVISPHVLVIVTHMDLTSAHIIHYIKAHRKPHQMVTFDGIYIKQRVQLSDETGVLSKKCFSTGGFQLFTASTAYEGGDI